jgi:alcohol dehydrogenase class IV
MVINVKKVIFRVFQFFVKIGVSLIKWKTDDVISEADYLKELPANLKNKNFKKIFLITDSHIYSLGLCRDLEEALSNNNLNYILYKEVVSNPTISSVEHALNIYKETSCDAIIAVGGGSVLDTAKLLGARFTNPQKTLKQMKGYFKVRKRIPYLVAVPTTAGSGSEATIVGVVSDENTHHKYAITSPKLIPHMVVLDPVITKNLP